MGATFARVKTWVSTEDVTYSDLNAEFDNILTYLTPAGVDDYSANVSQMQSTADPGEVGTESLATSLAGDIQRLRFLIKEITGEDYWYESPIASITGLSNAVGTGLTDNRIVSGRVRTNSQMPIFLVPNGAARTIKLDGTPTNFIYYVEGVEYTISSDVTLTNLTAAPSSNNTCLVNDAVAADQHWTKYAGEYGTEITVDTMGTEISGLVGKFAAFKLDNGSTTEYFMAHVTSATSLTKARRGYFFDSSDNPVPRIVFSNNDTITLMKLTWVFATTAGALTATYNNPIWSDDEPSSPSIGDYWFDTGANKWKKYDVSAYVDADALLVGVCIQDTSNCVAARSFDVFSNYDSLNTVEVIAESNSQAKSRYPGSQVNVYGSVISNLMNNHVWDMTLNLDSGVTEASSTYYFFYITETGDVIISDVRPHDRTEDLMGYYHTHQSWRCVGWAYNNGSSNLTAVESFHSAIPQVHLTPSIIAATNHDPLNDIVLLDATSGAFSYYLPPASLCRGKVYNFKKVDSSANAITIDGFGSETIDGATTFSISIQYEVLTIVGDGSNWHII